MKNLTEILYKYRDVDFKYGEIDCARFTANIVEEYFGINLDKWREILTYRNEKEALKIMNENGINSIKDLPDVVLNTPKKGALQAKLGEPVYAEQDGIGTIGICNGTRAYFLTIEKGLSAIPLDQCIYSWDIK